MVAAHEEAFSVIGEANPHSLVIQEGGAQASASIELLGAHGFCYLVRLRVVGPPPGVRVSVSAGVPGQRVSVSFRAALGAARAFDTPIKITAASTTHQRPERDLRLTVLPSQGDVLYSVTSSGWLTGLPEATFALEGHALRQVGGGGPGRGFNLMRIAGSTGLLIEFRYFVTWGSDDKVSAL